MEFAEYCLTVSPFNVKCPHCMGGVTNHCLSHNWTLDQIRSARGRSVTCMYCEKTFVIGLAQLREVLRSILNTI